MPKEATAYKKVVVLRPYKYQYTCDTCGYIFKKYERKVTYYTGGSKGKFYGCYKKPCTPFSNPKDYEYIWNIKKQTYKWVKLTPAK